MKKSILLLSIGLISASSFGQWSTGTNLLYTTNSNVSIGSNAIQGTYGTGVKALEIVSPTGTVINMKAGSSSLFLQHDATYPSGFFLSNTKPFNFYINSLTIPAIQIQTNGNVSVGRNGGPTDYKLAVAGKIITEEVKVQLQSAWPDYVFAKEYQLPSLEQVEKQIASKGHLADIPSAAKVKQDGFEVGEMNRLLLQKVEELTLYVIELNKTNQKQSELIETLNEKINAIEKR